MRWKLTELANLNDSIDLQSKIQNPPYILPGTDAKADISTQNRVRFDDIAANNLIRKDAPYISQGCVRQRNFKPITGAKYSNFYEGDISTKDAFGNDPVLGIFQNGDFPAQGNVGNKNRAVLSGLINIFTRDQLKEIYSTGGARTGMPRVFSTGPDTYTINPDRTKVYQGGWCIVENGRIVVRTNRAGVPFDPSLYGRNPDDPWHACARQGKTTVEDQNLQIFQHVWEIKYPSLAQCQQWFAVDLKTCSTFYRNRLGRDLAGNGISGNRIVYTMTFYGAFDDKYTKWVGWVNPDLNGSRRNSPDKFVQNYDGYSVFVLN